MTTVFVPDPETFARSQASGLTRYDRETVLTALAAWERAEAVYTAACTDLYERVVRPFEPERDFPGWERFAPEAVQAASALLVEVNCTRPYLSCCTRGAAESFPVRQWEKATRSLLHATKRLRRSTPA